MRLLTTAISLFLLSSCAHVNSTDPNSLWFSLPPGSILSLNQPLPISETETHGDIQAGKAVSNKNDYEINCRLDFRKFGPRTISPEKFTITRTEDGSNWISKPSILRFYSEIYLSSSNDTDVIKMVCQQYGDRTDRNFTVAEMQTALGEFITFEYQTKQ